jgi:hypothetical protein
LLFGENALKRFLGKKAAKELFLITAFPIHFWAFLQMIPHLEWLEAWDFIGVIKYVFLNSLAESAVVFLGFFILGGLLLPKQWEEDSKLLLIGIASWGLSLFLITDQIFRFTMDIDGPILGVSGLVVVSLTLLMLFMVEKNQKVRKGTRNVFEGAILMMYVYVGLDVLSIGLIVYQNIFLQ